MAGEARGEELSVTLSYLHYVWAQVTQAWAKRAKLPHPIPDDALRVIAGILGQRDMPILCLGARNRREPDFWRSQGYSDVTAVDLLPSRGVSFGDMHRLPFDDAMFDLIVASHVLEHAYDPGRALKELCRVLRRGGLLWAAWPTGPTFVRTEHDRIDYGSASAFFNYVRRFGRAELVWREDVAMASKALVRRIG